MGSLRTSGGFTLIEMLVVLAIIILMTGLIFSGQSNFNTSVILSSTAYDVALTLRDAETYGLSTRATASGVASAGYGLDLKSGLVTTYNLFADSYPPAGGTNACHPLPANGASAPNAYPGDCAYTSNDGLVSTYTLGNGVTISNFCASTNGTSWSCESGTTNVINQLDIIFLRPNPAPFISTNGIYSQATPMTSACITLSAGTNSRYISIAANGQIIATAASCP
jgi:prepilin-type N-terminal cleavage/methylation domain-containing protein